MLHFHSTVTKLHGSRECDTAAMDDLTHIFNADRSPQGRYPLSGCKGRFKEFPAIHGQTQAGGLQGFNGSAAFNGTREQILYKGGVTPSDHARAKCAKENIPVTKRPDV